MPDAKALDEQLQWSWARQLSFVIEVNPRYQWGGATSIQEGLDCSGYLYLTAKWAGIPVLRSTAGRMGLGLDGWISEPVPIRAAGELDLVFFTTKISRPNGHVGVIWDIEPEQTFTHSSSSKGVIVSPLMQGWWADKISGARTLTIGKQKGENKHE